MENLLLVNLFEHDYFRLETKGEKGVSEIPSLPLKRSKN